ncbi:MAG TPA: cupin domain-containing protein [Terrimicrobiaceae bacterium]|nr:cupin domain-containing protein [Terrimicrobiaceae bacterium]
MSSPHTLSVFALETKDRTPCGFRTAVTKANFPILRNMALYHLVIEPGCFREPHWHPNADEVGYCTAGSALVTIFSNGNQHDHFTITAGEMFFVPSGSIHAIENTGTARAEFVLSFSSDSPEDFGLSGAVGCMTPEVLGNTWGRKASELGSVTRSLEDVLFGRTAGTPEIPESASFANRLKFSIEAREPLLRSEIGSVRVARMDTWPVLRHQGMYSLRLRGTGMREPHWHPETAEMGFVLQGRARMTIKNPGTGVDTYELQPGDMYFIPRAYPHHIENLGEDEVRFLIFFDTPFVQDIGYTGAIPAFPPRIITPTIGLDAALIPDRASDLLLVPKVRPTG